MASSMQTLRSFASKAGGFGVIPAWRRVKDGMVDFGVGQPARDCLPKALMQRAAAELLQSQDVDERLYLQYGAAQGERDYLTSVAQMLNEHAAASMGSQSNFPLSKAEPNTIMATNGVSQGVDFICAALAEKGDIVLMVRMFS